MTDDQEKSDAGKALSVLGAKKGGEARAKALSAEERSRIAREAVEARWRNAGKLQTPRATHKGNFKEEFGLDVDCYVLNDEGRTAVISQRGMAQALGFSPQGGSRFPRFLSGKNIASYIGLDLRQKLTQPVIFQSPTAGSGVGPTGRVFGFDVTILIDMCKAIVSAESDGKLLPNQRGIAKQAHVILSASAKAGIKGWCMHLLATTPQGKRLSRPLNSTCARRPEIMRRNFQTSFMKNGIGYIGSQNRSAISRGSLCISL